MAFSFAIRIMAAVIMAAVLHKSLACHLATTYSVISLVYMTSHGFILLRNRPSTAVTVPPAQQCEPAKNHDQNNPNKGSHPHGTIS
jgi:hypothetical protein